MSPLRLDRGREPRAELSRLRRFPVQSQTDAEMSERGYWIAATILYTAAAVGALLVLHAVFT